MCGIAGIWHPDGRAIDRLALSRMTRALAHRGPDDEGFYVRPGIGLGHRRLSIIDLHAGHQPLCNEDGSVWITFNGEIFNYLELREELEERGHTFKTRSDTEVLVHLYEEHGLDFLERLNGQFALGLWDERRRRLVLARDRVGIRPLFHSTLADGSVVFASEIKALFAYGLRAEIDPVAVAQVATVWVTIPPRTAFKNIDELAPGNVLFVEPTRRKERRYWHPTFPNADEYEEKTLAHWQDRVRELLYDAVRLQLRSDVPVGTYLSGGLDSSILTSLIRQQTVNDVKSFSIGFGDERYDETPFQRLMSAHLGTDHRSITVDYNDIGKSFADVVWWAERPVMRTAPAPLLTLSRHVRDNGIKVVLTGEGADEIFGGYNIFRETKVRRFWAQQPLSERRPLLLSKLYEYVRRDNRADAMWREFFRRGIDHPDDPYFSHRLRWSNGRQILLCFSPEFRAEMGDEEAILAEIERYLATDRSKWHPLCQAQYLEMTLFMSGYLLNSQGDRMMMAHSVEGRVPFLDHRLIELAAQIPPRFKLRRLDEKYVLKKAFEERLPPAITSRPKQPYRAPISACFRGDSDNVGAALLQRPALEQTGFANPAAVAKLMEKSRRGGLGEREEMAIATIVSLQLLHHHFVHEKRASARSA